MSITPAQWLTDYQPSPTDIDCITTVMLKILDGKCRMSEQGKTVMTELYDLVKQRQGLKLGEESHSLIAKARLSAMDDALRMQLYEQRLLAETMISRPVMKAFKARLRQEGLLGDGVRI